MTGVVKVNGLVLMTGVVIVNVLLTETDGGT